MTTEARPLSEAVGAQVRKRRLARGWRLEDLAAGAETFGFRWSSALVSQIENGRRSMTIGTLVTLAACLECSLSDLVDDGDEFVQVTPDAAMLTSTLVAVLNGSRLDRRLSLDVVRTDAELVSDLADSFERLLIAGAARKAVREEGTIGERILVDQIERRGRQAEERAARDLGWTTRELAAASAALWGRTLSEERDAITQPSMTPQAKGHITRHLIEQLRAFKGGA